MMLFRTITSRINHESVPIVRIFLNFVHFLIILNGIFTTADLWSENANMLMKILDYAAAIVLPFSVDQTCMTKELTLADAHYLKVMFLATLPVILFVLAGFFAFFSCNAKCKGWSFTRWLRHSCIYFTVPMFVAWPSILIGLI